MRVQKKGEKIWNLVMVKNWLSFKSNGDNFISDAREDTEDDSDGEFTRRPRQEATDGSNLNEEGPQYSVSGLRTGLVDLRNDKPRIHSSGASKLLRGQSEILWKDIVRKEELKLSVVTWNVAGKSPHEDLEGEEWLGSDEPVDLYVFGFQEIVPLNAGNVLGNEDNMPAVQWDELIRKTLNGNQTQSRGKRGWSAPSTPTSTSINHVSHTPHLMKAVTIPDLSWTTISEVSQSAGIDLNMKEDINEEQKPLEGFNSDLSGYNSNTLPPLLPASRSISSQIAKTRQRPLYVRVASKQMVGIFISIWIRRHLRRHVHAVRVSSVGCGIMGYLGNKGSVSVSLSLCRTTFCFICTHLSSGEKEGDELRRNSDVTEILRRTQFSCHGKFAGMDLPETIFEHDRIICLGDLNYRLSISEPEDMKRLIANEDWRSLLEKDQLKLEQNAQRVFVNWQEGTIDFAPTYKYIRNSDLYYGIHSKQGEKRRSPAWCDRILWYGAGLRILEYARSESKLSDHRPVKAIFMAEVESLRRIDELLLTKVKLQKFQSQDVIKETLLDMQVKEC